MITNFINMIIQGFFLIVSVMKLEIFCIIGVSRENFNIVINAKDYDFDPTDTPRTDRSVRFSDP